MERYSKPIRALSLLTLLLFIGCFKTDDDDYFKSYNCSGTTCLGLTDYSGNYSTKSSCENACASSANCDFAEWTGSNNCNSGYVPVYSNTCCPSSSPYHNTATNNCFTSCEAAKNANSSGKVYKGTSSGSGGNTRYECRTVIGQSPKCSPTTSLTGYPSLAECQAKCGGSGPCQYHTYNVGTTNFCPAGKVRVSATYCCPSNYPYYCEAQEKCFLTCEAAENSNCDYIRKGIKR